MRIEKVIIDGFRNIGHAEYDQLEALNVFVGPNRQGKTNTILAIYWALADCLLDGSVDFQSFKPYQAEQATVSVELICDTFTLKKVYKGWRPRQQGSGELGDLQHTTEYWIDGTKYKSQSEAKKELAHRLGTDVNMRLGKFDLTRALIDPYYIGEGCDWKELRSFIIELIGDVSNEDVLAAEPSLIAIKETMQRFGFDPGMAQKFIKQQIAESKKQIESKQQQIAGLQSVADVDADALEAAQKRIAEIEQEQAVYRATLKGDADPLLNEKKAQLADLSMKLADSVRADEKSTAEKNKEIEAELRISEEVADYAASQMLDMNKQRVKMENLVLGADDKIKALQKRVEQLKETRQRLLDEYHAKNAEQYEQDGEKVQACPNCGHVLNQDALDDYRKDWEKRKQKELSFILRDGQQTKADIENGQFKVQELEKEKEEAEAQLPLIKQQIREFEKTHQTAKEAAYKLRKSLVSREDSETTKALEAAVRELRAKVKQMEEDKLSGANDLAKKIDDLEKEKEAEQATVNAHIAFLGTQKRIAEIKKEADAMTAKLIEREQEAVLVTQFLEVKLNLFQQRIASVFGQRVKFTLISQNLKKGSWDEVCYPSVLDKDTPFENGSGSEKILTGIYLAECIKDKLGLNDLPYIFDECDKLDTVSLATMNTHSQRFTTKVDDVNYSRLTLIHG